MGVEFETLQIEDKSYFTCCTIITYYIDKKVTLFCQQHFYKKTQFFMKHTWNFTYFKNSTSPFQSMQLSADN